jgi:hypothetical protein
VKKITAVASQYLLRDAGAHMHYSGGGGGRGYAGNSTMQAMHALHALHTTFYNQVPATQAGDLRSLKLAKEGTQSAVYLAWA